MYIKACHFDFQASNKNLNRITLTEIYQFCENKWLKLLELAIFL